jgi:hypothetical protein
MNLFKAPKGKFRIVCADYAVQGLPLNILEGDFDSYDEAAKICQAKGGVMLLARLFNDNGECLFEAGTSW